MSPTQPMGPRPSTRAAAPWGAWMLPTTTTVAQAAMATRPPSQIHAGGPPATDTPTASPVSPRTVSTDHARGCAAPPSFPGGQSMAATPPIRSSQARVSVPR